MLHRERGRPCLRAWWRLEGRAGEQHGRRKLSFLPLTVLGCHLQLKILKPLLVDRGAQVPGCVGGKQENLKFFFITCTDTAG